MPGKIHMARLVLRSLLFLVLLVSSAGTGDAENRVALVIGNSDYQHTQRLANPENDARLIAAVLAERGFEVIQHTNLGFKETKRAINEFTSRLEFYGKDTVGLIFYAGHGVQVDGQNYLVPVDAQIGKEGDVAIEAISSQTLLSGVQMAGNRLNIIILDACRNNPYRGSFRSSTRGLARMDAPIGSLVAFSTAPGMVAADGDGASSPYATALAKLMAQPGLKLEEVFKQVRQHVHEQTDGAQVPWESSSIFGDFFFTPPELASGTQATQPSLPDPLVDDRAIELAFWQSISDSSNKVAFEAYLERYPAGEFAALARLKLDELERRSEAEEDGPLQQDDPQAGRLESEPDPSPAADKDGADDAVELAYWNSIKDSTNAAELASYLKAYPEGAFSALARLRLDALESARKKTASPQPPPSKSAARANPFDGLWQVVRTSPSCRRVPSARFMVSIASGKLRWARGSGSVGADGSLRFKGQGGEGREAEFVGKLSGNSGSGSLIGRFAGRTCSGTFTITRLND